MIKMSKLLPFALVGLILSPASSLMGGESDEKLLKMFESAEQTKQDKKAALGRLQSEIDALKERDVEIETWRDPNDHAASGNPLNSTWGKDPVERIAEKILVRTPWEIRYRSDADEYTLSNGPNIWYHVLNNCASIAGFSGPSVSLSFLDFASIGMKVERCPEKDDRDLDCTPWVDRKPHYTDVCFPSMLVDWTPDIQQWVDSDDFKKVNELIKTDPTLANALIRQKLLPHAITRTQLMEAVKLAKKAQDFGKERKSLQKGLSHENVGLRRYAEEQDKGRK